MSTFRYHLALRRYPGLRRLARVEARQRTNHFSVNFMPTTFYPRIEGRNFSLAALGSRVEGRRDRKLICVSFAGRDGVAALGAALDRQPPVRRRMLSRLLDLRAGEIERLYRAWRKRHPRRVRATA